MPPLNLPSYVSGGASSLVYYLSLALYIHTLLCEKQKTLTRLDVCASLSESSLLADAISNLTHWPIYRLQYNDTDQPVQTIRY